MFGQVAEILTARGALAAAHAGTRLPGSSTACILRLNRPNRTIDAANLVGPARFSRTGCILGNLDDIPSELSSLPWMQMDNLRAAPYHAYVWFLRLVPFLPVRIVEVWMCKVE